ncbi:hypothetical protein [Fredinandcohnia quinoae]|uniref:Uncharacterized protein n=1 Tax=Fredinandcohnia quinoae TaxID=2918902 RepID=A0AAW5E111_9BACI|nr:hypothetical protein [Fredinandcohnia sp. SECRCQ15]MCH1625259.1 hypothetical protein [Fredinandcohnia sp. SECRCQ15]
MVKRKKEIYCEECSMEIKDKTSLVISTYFFLVAPYHERCYSRSLKGCQTAFVGNEPINGFSGNFKAIAAFVIAIILFIINGPYLFLGILAIIPALIRIYAWLTIERHLE